MDIKKLGLIAVMAFGYAACTRHEEAPPAPTTPPAPTATDNVVPPPAGATPPATAPAPEAPAPGK